MLLALVLAVAPVALPPPSVQPVPGCAAAACTGDPDLRVCKCIPEGATQPPGMTVDRRPPEGEEPRHVEWDAPTVGGVVDDFTVVSADLDGDGKSELIVASRMTEAAARVFVVGVVDGREDVVTLAWTQDFGVDAVAPRSLLFTEWDSGNFVGREFAYSRGRLEPTRAPVLRRVRTPGFDVEREARPQAPRAWLSKDATKGQDEPPRALRTVSVMGLTRDDGVLGLHLELPGGGMASLSVGADAVIPLRLGNAPLRRLYPPGYTPADAERWLSGRLVAVPLDGGVIVGAVWVDAAGAKVPVRQ